MVYTKWLFCLLLAGSSSEEQKTNQSQAGQLSVQRLRIQADEALARFNDAKHVLFKAGATQKGFACEGPDSTLAEEPPKIGFRRLELSIDEVQSSGMSSMLTGLLGDAEDSGGPSQLFLIEAKVVVVTSTDDPTPLLSVALDRQESDGPMEVFEGDQLENSVTILYDCWQQGTARVELRFLLANALGPGAQSQEICMAWRKTCGSFGFEALQVRHGQSLIYPPPEKEQPALLSAEGTYEEVTKLQLSTLGAMRLKLPKVTSEEQLKVELRGVATDVLEVTQSEDVEISIVYSCLSAGIIGVELALERAVLSAAHAPEVLHLHWRKHCGDSVYRSLDVFLKQNSNKTQVVSKGRTLAGFVHCPKLAAESGAVDGTKPVAKPECLTEPTVEVGPKDPKTSIELRLDPEGNPIPPSLQPPPDLSFDRKILRAYFQGMETGSLRPNKPVNAPSLSRASSSTMVVRYSCHRAGVSSIVVTVYVMQHKPIDFAWRKRCAEPKIHTSKALTAPQAMTFAFLVCGLIGIVVCMVCLFCSSNQDKHQLFQGPITKKIGRGERKGSGRSPDRREIEFWHVGPDSQKVGYEYEEEIVYHPNQR